MSLEINPASILLVKNVEETFAKYKEQ